MASSFFFALGSLLAAIANNFTVILIGYAIAPLTGREIIANCSVLLKENDSGYWWWWDHDSWRNSRHGSRPTFCSWSLVRISGFHVGNWIGLGSFGRWCFRTKGVMAMVSSLKFTLSLLTAFH